MNSTWNRIRNAVFTLRIWVYTLSFFVSLIVGVYCVYRAVQPIAGMYADVLNDPMGDRTGDPDTQAIRNESWRWAAFGVVFVIGSGILGWLTSIAWYRRWTARNNALPGPVPGQPGLARLGSGKYVHQSTQSTERPAAKPKNN